MKSISPRTILRHITAICRDNISVFEQWESRSDLGKGAKGEARGTVETCKEILRDIRLLKQRKIPPDGPRRIWNAPPAIR